MDDRWGEKIVDVFWCQLEMSGLAGLDNEIRGLIIFIFYPRSSETKCGR